MKLSYHKNGHGRPLILLHGLFGSGDNWYSLSKVFGGKFCTYAVDQRNHGRSPHSDIFSYKAMAEDLDELLIDQEIEATFLLGHSMGGKTAMQFAAMYPDKLDKLVVVDIAPRAYEPEHDKIFDAMFRLDLQKYSTRTELDSALAASVTDPAVRQLLLKNVERSNAGRFRWKIEIESIHKNYANVNAEIIFAKPFERPTLLIRGSESAYVQDSDISNIRDIFPQSEIATIKGVGHWVHAEAPAEFSKIVMEFLTR